MSTDVWVVGLKKLSEFGCNLGGIFIVPYTTALVFAPIINMRQTGPWETDWIVISLEQTKGLAGFVHFRSCFESVQIRRTGDTV